MRTQAPRFVDTDPKRGEVVVRATGTRHDEPTSQGAGKSMTMRRRAVHGFGRCVGPCRESGRGRGREPSRAGSFSWMGSILADTAYRLLVP
ncbi:hypothetical protein GCM10010230_24750 [Streptomyces narbonensis]|nr:hypothetical protein GCM10010230_24750 [Streptomyces narbonensis]